MPALFLFQSLLARTNALATAIRTYLLSALLVATAALAQSPQLSRNEVAATEVAFTVERDAATIFMAVRSAFITSMAQRCRKELGMRPSKFDEPELEHWEAKHNRYNVAATRYIFKKREASELLYRAWYREVVLAVEKANVEVATTLEKAPDRVETCRTFLAESEAGKFDINIGDKYYESLETLARELFDPRPRP